jgi:Tfp pilus assembly protein PilO
MMQFILPVFILLASVGVFFGFTKNEYKTVQDRKAEVAEYDKAVQNSTTLLKKREELLDLKNKFQKNDLNRLNILMPDDVNSTKLIIEIEHLAKNVHNLSFEDPKYDPGKKIATAGTKDGGAPAIADSATPARDIKSTLAKTQELEGQKDYGSFELEFTLTGKYSDFISFLGDLEKSLRIVDIQQLEITPKESKEGKGGDVLKYVLKVQTYWLKS